MKKMMNKKAGIFGLIGMIVVILVVVMVLSRVF